MNRIAIALAALVGLAGTAHAQLPPQPADCPSASDSCVVPSGTDFLDFYQPFSGSLGDTIVFGKGDTIWGSLLVACVDGGVQYMRDAAGNMRTALTKNSMVCVGGGNDVVKVLAPGETLTCSYYGFPITMTAFQYGSYELAIYGQGGADQITGGDGNDQLCGGSGNDRIWGRKGLNELNGGIGNDDLYGGSDIDWIYGADGDDIVDDSAGTGGFRRVCYTGGQQLPPSRLEAGAGNDCMQAAPFEDGWCYAQIETCNNGSLPCHGGLYCAAGYDRFDTPGPQGLECEVITNGLPCRR
jgi:hypothetical protein